MYLSPAFIAVIVILPASPKSTHKMDRSFMQYAISDSSTIDIKARYTNASAAKPQYDHPRFNIPSPASG